jgi:prepilin signal peptidase PulO-like enzyme (type II secretory pathway)
MDVLHLCLILLAAVVGWLAGVPLLWIGDRLLSCVPSDAAAPVTADVSRPTDLPLPALMPTALTGYWRLAVPGILAVGLGFSMQRVNEANLPLLDAMSVLLILGIVIGSLALVAAIDGTAHLIFIEILAVPVVMVLLIVLLRHHAVWQNMLLGGGVAGMLFLGFFLLGWMMYGTDVIGFGDVQLAVAFGILLGWPLVVPAIMLGFILLSIVACILLAWRKITPRTYLPIGAFMVLGALGILLFASPVWM